MRGNLLRPALGLGRAEFYRAQESTRSFTTSQFFNSDNDNAADRPRPRPNYAERNQRTANEVNSLLRNSPSDRPFRTPEGAGAPTRGKIINLQSLSRARGRGGLRGGSLANLARPADGDSPREGGNRRFGRGGPRTGGGAGGFMRRRRRDDGETQRDDDRNRRRGGPKAEAETLEERQARIDREVGVTTRYNPSTTLDALVPFLPEVATDSNPLGRIATAMTTVRVLTGGFVDPNPIVNAEDMYQDYRNKGSIFFTNMRVRKALEEQAAKAELTVAAGPDEVVKDTIMRRAVLGEYNEVKPVDRSDTLAVTRNFQLKEGSYLEGQSEMFENKLTSLLAKSKARPRAKQAAA